MRVIDFYDRHPISEQHVLDAVRRARSVGPLAAEDLFAFDQDHYGGLAAVDVLARRAGITASSRVLDICAGLGGPARFLASRRRCRVVGVEPVAGDDATRSFRSRTLQSVRVPDTVADGARTPSLGRLTFQIVMERVADMTTVDDRTLLRAMFYLWERMKLLIEPTGALGAAALLETGIAGSAQRIGVILSGGNVDLSQVERWRGMLEG